MKLIRKIQNSRIGSRDLDADFYEAMGFEVQRASRWKWFNRETRRWTSMSRPTQSIDDAVSKIPEGWERMVDARSGGLIEVNLYHDTEEFAPGRHDTEPMATCIAILYAIQTESE